MDILNYCVVSGVSIIFLIGCMVHLCENDVFSTRRIRKFFRLIILLMVEIVVDLVFILLEHQRVGNFVLYLVKGIELSLNPILAFLVFDVFYDKRADKSMTTIRIVMIFLVLANILLQLAGLFGYHVFTIDENGIYHRGPLVIAYVVLLLLTVFFLLIGLVTFSGRTQGTMMATLFVFTMILVLSIVIRNAFENSSYDFLCLSVSIPFLLLYYSHVTLRVDSLTKLLNRHVYQRMIKRIDYSTIIIMIDANSFKVINDTYGHECGDQTLKQIASLICEAYGRYAYCFRIGGDEFCVILKPGMYEKMLSSTPHRDIYSATEKFMEKLDDLILACAGDENSEGFLKYGVSQGYGIYYSEANYPSVKERMTLDNVIKLADERMYHEKEQFRKDHPEFCVVPKRPSKRVRVLYKPTVPELVKDVSENDI